MQGINPPTEIYAELVRGSLAVKDEIRAEQVLDTIEANDQTVAEVSLWVVCFLISMLCAARIPCVCFVRGYFYRLLWTAKY